MYLQWFLLGMVLANAQCDAIELFDSLNHLIRYFNGHPKIRTADAMLGIYLCKGQV